MVGGIGDGVTAVGSDGRKGVRVGELLADTNSRVDVGLCDWEGEFVGVETGKLQLLVNIRTSQVIVPAVHLYRLALVRVVGIAFVCLVV